MPRCLANIKRLAVGSEPADSRNTSGIFGELSPNEAPKSNGGGSTNDLSRLRVMKAYVNETKGS